MLVISKKYKKFINHIVFLPQKRYNLNSTMRLGETLYEMTSHKVVYVHHFNGNTGICRFYRKR